MSRVVFPLLFAVAACSGGSEPDPVAPEVAVMASCVDDLCEELVLEAVTLGGEPSSWEWTLADGSKASGQRVHTTLGDGLDVHEVVVGDEWGGSHRTKSAVVTLEMAVAAPGGEPVDKDETIVIVPMGSTCDWIPVVNIGGCLFGGGVPLGLDIDAATIDTVTFSVLDGSYTSSQVPARARWRIGSFEEIAPLSVSSDYTGLPAPSPPSEHFTAYFEGLIGGTSTVVVSHGPFPSKVYSAHEIGVTCNEDGRIVKIVRRPVDRANLDFDGDGFVERDDCDETDPDVHERC